jgi:hypothetical protein
MGTNDLKKTRKIDFVFGDVYALVAKTKEDFPNCRIVLCGVLRSTDVSWRFMWALNDGIVG